MPAAPPDSTPQAALGLDAGGTGTRWALVRLDGGMLAEGESAPISGAQLFDDAGRAALAATLASIAGALPEPAAAVLAGITAYDGAAQQALLPLLVQAFALPGSEVVAMSDIELLCRAAFAPGEGIVLYAGTGAVAAQLDALGLLHRVGGRGAVLDDAGGGHWIAREALKAVWRAEDDEPGTWQRSALAHSLFGQVGGSDWAATRRYVYSASRGQLGTLARAVAEAAPRDATAHGILEQAGRELARLATTLLRRFGRHPVALAGRVFELHPVIERTLVAALPPGTKAARFDEPAHRAAARLARQHALARGRRA